MCDTRLACDARATRWRDQRARYLYLKIIIGDKA